MTGHVLLKNELGSEGVLALNIGVIDPGYNGLISSTLINFGRADVQVEVGRPFLRVSFHRCPISRRTAEARHWTRPEYLKHVRQQVLAYSGPNFLNMDQATAEAAKQAFGSFRNALFLWAGVIAVILAVITTLVPLGALVHR